MDGSSNTRTEDILLTLIIRSATNPRTTFDEDSLRELGQSMATVGQIHPALVRPKGELFELIAGERRWRAAALAGLLTLRCEVRDLSDDVVEEIQLVENAGREDVHPLEEAIALDKLVRNHKRTPEYLADRLGHSVQWVRRRLALLGLTEDARAWLRDGQLPIAHAQQLAAVDAATQGRVLAKYTGPHATGVPSSREFARAIGYELHGLDAAPFDPGDAKLPGHGPCAKCMHRSDTQGDLFGGASSGALCLDAACWDGKVAATWERAVKAAPKKHLTVLSEPKDVFSYGSELRWDAEFQKTPVTADAKPVALARTQSGHVVELYAKAPPKSAAPRDGDGEEDDENEGDDGEGATAAQRPSKWDLERAEAEAKRAVRIRQLLGLAAQVHLEAMLRTALHGYVTGVSNRAFRIALGALGVVTDNTSDAALIDALDAGQLVPLLCVVLAADELDACDELEEGEELPPFEAELIEMMKSEAPAAEPTQAAAPVEPPPVLVRLWLPARPFGELTDDGRASYDHPDVVADLAWETRGDWTTAEMTEGVARIVRDLARDDSFEVREGDDAPPALTTELRVNRGAWLQHRSGLRDTAKAPLHKQWDPDGDDRVVRVERGAAVVAQVLDYCREHKVPLRLNGAELLAPEAPAKAPKASKSSKGATAPKPPATTPDEASAPEDDSRFDPLRGTVLVFRDDDYWGRNGKKGVGSDRSLSASQGGIGSTCGGDLRPFTIVGPVRPGDARLEAAMAAATKAGVSFLALDDVDTSEARALAEKSDAAWTVAKPAKTPNKPVAPTAPAPRVERVADDVLAVLSTMEVDGTLAKITEGALDRKLYERTNKVLEALGGTWSKKLKGHVFVDDPHDALDGVILTGAVSHARDVLGFFPTPTELVQELLFRADEDGAMDNLTLLEPSAGEGAIVGAALKLPYYKVTAVELDAGRHRTLTSRYGDLLAENVCGDFLRWDTDQRFDRVVMNPPFARGQDVEHVTYAFRLLAPGGRLVAVMSAGVAFREDRKTVAFRELVREAGGTITENPEGSFKSSGTGVRTVTVVMDRKAVA